MSYWSVFLVGDHLPPRYFRRLLIRLLTSNPKRAFFPLTHNCATILWAAVCLTWLLPGIPALVRIPPSSSILFATSTLLLFQHLCHNFIFRPRVPYRHPIHWVNERCEVLNNCPSLLLVILLLLILIILQYPVCTLPPVPCHIWIRDMHVKNTSRPMHP